MTEAERKFSIVAALIVTVSVGINLFFLQDARRQRIASRVDTQQENSGLLTQAVAVTEKQVASDGVVVRPPAAIADASPMNMAEVIRGVQRELNARGYEAGSPDGVAGLITRAAIMAYENDYGLAITARPNEALLSRIVLGSSVPPAAAVVQDTKLTADAEAIVRTVKELLGEAGYQPGKVDGAITPQLRRTIREFEIAQRLPESARISGPLVSRLVRLQATGAQSKGSTPRTTTR